MRSAFAPETLISRELSWFPVLTASGRPSDDAPQVRWALWYSGLGSSMMGAPLRRALSTGRLGWTQPSMARRAGTTKSKHVTAADTGLPGNAKKRTLRSSLVMVANVVGFLRRRHAKRNLVKNRRWLLRQNAAESAQPKKRTFAVFSVKFWNFEWTIKHGNMRCSIVCVCLCVISMLGGLVRHICNNSSIIAVANTGN